LQTEKIKKLKARRSESEAKSSLVEIATAARDGRNLMPLVIEAVEKYCTLGEISDALREVFGEYK